MCKQSLISLALISFSVVSNAAAIPIDADQAMLDATQSAVLYRDVALVQGGGFDKDVAAALAITTMDKCQGDVACNNNEMPSVVIGDMRIYANQSVSDWFVQGNPSALQPLVVSLILLSVVVFFLSRKSASTK